MFGNILVQFVHRRTEEVIQEQEFTLTGASFIAESELNDSLAREIYLKFFCQTTGVQLSHVFDSGNFIGFEKMEEEAPSNVTVH